MCFITKWSYMAYITLSKLFDQHLVSDLNMGILLKMCFTSKWWYMSYTSLAKLFDQQCGSDLNISIVLNTNVLHYQMVV